MMLRQYVSAWAKARAQRKAEERLERMLAANAGRAAQYARNRAAQKRRAQA